MKIVFVYKGAENLGIEYLSSVLRRQGHKIHLVFDPGLFSDKYYLNMSILGKFFDQRNRIISDILDLKPDLVAFSVITDLYQWASQMASQIKKVMDVPIVFGGIHPTSVPEVCIKNDFVDYVIVGEGEDSLAELVNNLEQGSAVDRIGNLWFKRGGQVIKNPVRPLIQNLDEIPFPDKKLFASSVMVNDSYLIMTARGCLYSCSFCANNVLRKVYAHKGRYIRRRSAENVIKELVYAKETYHPREITFCDDIFTLDKQWLRGFLRDYRYYIGLPFRCLSHPIFFDYEIATMLKESNCSRLKLSPQTMNENNRKKILKRTETNEQIIRSFKICDDLGIRYTIDHMLGIPDDTEKDYLCALELYSRSRYLSRIKCYYLCYFPKIDIIDFAKASSILSEEDTKDIEEGRQKFYFSGNTALEKNKDRWKTAQNFSVFFRLLPIFPRFFCNLIIRIKLYKKFYLVPSLLIYPIEGIIAIKNKDTIAIPYLKYYLYHLKGSIRKFIIKRPVKKLIG